MRHGAGKHTSISTSAMPQPCIYAASTVDPQRTLGIPWSSLSKSAACAYVIIWYW
jgi:hypothetical protein